MPYPGPVSVAPLSSHATARPGGLARRPTARPANSRQRICEQPHRAPERYGLSRNICTDSSRRRIFAHPVLTRPVTRRDPISGSAWRRRWAQRPRGSGTTASGRPPTASGLVPGAVSGSAPAVRAGRSSGQGGEAGAWWGLPAVRSRPGPTRDGELTVDVPRVRLGSLADGAGIFDPDRPDRPHPIRRPAGAFPGNCPTWVAAVRERITTVSATETWWPSNVMPSPLLLSGPATTSSEVTTSPQGSIRLGT